MSPSSTIIATPATLDDLMSNHDVYAGFAATAASLGITDTAILGAIQAQADAAFQAGAAALISYATSQKLEGPPVVTRNGVDYAVDESATPPTLVPDSLLDPTTVPVAPTTSP